jgi:L-fuculose-phosphate aldolase
MNELVDELIEAGRQIVAAGLVRGSGGNLSGREGEQVQITRSGADLGCLQAADFVLVGMEGVGESRPSPRPSSELSMHLAAYRARPESQVILHVHPPKAISLGMISRSLPAITPDFYLHLGSSVPLLPYTTPTTEKLGRAAGRLLQLSPAILLQNHGVLVCGRDVKQALLRLFLIEEHAAIYLDALAAGRPRRLSPIEMRQLDEVTGGRYKQKREG